MLSTERFDNSRVYNTIPLRKLTTLPQMPLPELHSIPKFGKTNSVTKTRLNSEIEVRNRLRRTSLAAKFQDVLVAVRCNDNVILARIFHSVDAGNLALCISR